MSLPRFLVGMLGVLVVFALASYLVTHSISTTLVQTVICAVLLQLGYFCAVLFLVRQEKRKLEPAKPDPSDIGSHNPGEERSTIGSPTLPGVGPPRPY